MAKRSRRRTVRYERDQAGCIWSFISIFDFRNGRSTRKLLADRRRGARQVVGDSDTKLILPTTSQEHQTVKDGGESKMVTMDAAKTSVKELMEEEMCKEQDSKNQAGDPEADLEELDLKLGEQMKKNQKQSRRTYWRSGNMHVSKLDVGEFLKAENITEFLEQRCSSNCDLEATMEELIDIYQKNSDSTKNEFCADMDLHSDQTFSFVEEKLRAAIKELIQQRLSNNKQCLEDGKTHHSKEFTDALRSLSSKNGLFLKLLEDPNTPLAKYMKNIEDNQVEKDQKSFASSESNMPDEKLTKLKQDDLSNHKHRNFFRRRSRSLESFPSVEDEKCRSSSKIVILKPGPAGLGNSYTDIDMSTQNKIERNPSQFSFTEIKRKLKNAIGKEKRGISPDGLTHRVPSKHQHGSYHDKGIVRENTGWSSPNRRHFYTEKFTKSTFGFTRGEQNSKPKDTAASLNQNSGYPRQGPSNIYIEAKKHLSEMLNHGDENAESFSRQLPKSLGRILSLPEYSDSPYQSPRNQSDDVFITARMRFSSHDSSQMVNSNIDKHDDRPSPSQEDIETQSPIMEANANGNVQSPDTHISKPFQEYNDCSIELHSLVEDKKCPEEVDSSSRVLEIEETVETSNSEEERISANVFETRSNPTSADPGDGDIDEVQNEESSSQNLKLDSQCLKLDSFNEEQILSSPSVSPLRSPVARKLEDPDSVIDRGERPSPVSVLEPLFTEDDISPARKISQTVDKDIQPREIHFEEQSCAGDQGIFIGTSAESEESAFEYVEAVLLGSGLNWDEFLLRWLSLSEILDPPLFDEVELFSSRPRHDQKLLFDCTNEVLTEVCERYFGCSTLMSFVKPNIRPAPKGMDLINEVWGRVEWHLSQYIAPHSLDQLVKKDLANSRKWMDHRLETEHIGNEMGEFIFDELVEDTIQSFLNDNSVCEFIVLSAASPEAEGGNL